MDASRPSCVLRILGQSIVPKTPSCYLALPRTASPILADREAHLLALALGQPESILRPDGSNYASAS